MSTSLEPAPIGDGEVFTYELTRTNFGRADLEEARVLLEEDGVAVIDGSVIVGDAKSHIPRGEVGVRPELAAHNRAKLQKFGFGVIRPAFQI